MSRGVFHAVLVSLVACLVLFAAVNEGLLGWGFAWYFGFWELLILVPMMLWKAHKGAVREVRGVLYTAGFWLGVNGVQLFSIGLLPVVNTP